MEDDNSEVSKIKLDIYAGPTSLYVYDKHKKIMINELKEKQLFDLIIRTYNEMHAKTKEKTREYFNNLNRK
jgi:hypothetical protein